MPHGHFRARDGNWVAIACTTDRMFERLAEAMERPELASHSMYGEQRKRLAARDEVNKIVTEWALSLDREELMRRCIAREVPIGKLNSIADIFADEHFQARGNLARWRKKGWARSSSPMSFLRCPRLPDASPTSGQPLATRPTKCMRELLGLKSDEISGLRQQRII